jgi:hypothetical protein
VIHTSAAAFPGRGQLFDPDAVYRHHEAEFDQCPHEVGYIDSFGTRAGGLRTQRPADRLDALTVAQMFYRPHTDRRELDERALPGAAHYIAVVLLHDSKRNQGHRGSAGHGRRGGLTSEAENEALGHDAAPLVAVPAVAQTGQIAGSWPQRSARRVS